jgi:hypothetical protein
MINSKEKYGAFVTATNREFLNIFKTLSDTRSVKGVNYAKAVIKNLQVIKEHLQPIEEMALPSEEFIELSVKAQEFINKEDSEGLQKFEGENQELIEKRKKQMDEVNAKLDEIATVELVLIDEKVLPEDISAEQIEALMKIIQ